MQLFNAVFTNEMSKIIKRKKFLTAAIISLIAIIIGQLIVVLVKNFSGINIAGTSSFPFLVLSVFSHTLIPLFGIFVAVDLFSGEFNANTMKLILSRPVSRFKVFSAKVASLGVFVFSHLIFSMIISLISTMIFSGFKINFVAVFTAYIVNFLPILLFLILVVLISNLIKGSTAVFMVSILAFLVLLALGIIFSAYGSFFIVPLFGWFTMFTGAFLNIDKILRTFLIIISMSTMLYSAGYFLFEKRSL